ncbi:COMPASS (complex proteins associated with Set1p) component [Fusarium equiseti]|uniref:COMPASS (Complex proteins associated with Set1p) component n=1 Tax=Fusarium equiseti TaxID=61235 RepID=A0ABQ8RSX2_FUSEQ|nr:COMPASS (complex proteins associated with Set1p) component [Fusarium equiseti]
MAEETSKNETATDTPQIAVPPDSAANGLPADQPKDVVMSDAPVDPSSPAPAAHAPSPVPARTGTPAQGSRAASAHPDPGVNIPAEAPLHGDSTRRYLNTKVTGALLEGMKQLAKDKPSDPLRVLGEYLIQKSKDLEGTG